MYRKAVAQGDVMFVRVRRLPRAATEEAPEGGQYVVSHSETGHHHTVEADGRCTFHYVNPFTCYLQVTGDYVDVVHHRPFDTHAPVRLARGKWLVRRQREYTPQGFRRVED